MSVYITLPNSSTKPIADDIVIVNGKLCLASDNTLIGTGVSADWMETTFTCDSKYFIDSAIAYNIGGQRSYSKYNSEPAVGMSVVINQGGSLYTCGLFLSPVSADAVSFISSGDIATSSDSITYNGVTWYYSSTEYALSGELPCTGLVKFTSTISAPYQEETLVQILQTVHAKNKS